MRNQRLGVKTGMLQAVDQRAEVLAQRRLQFSIGRAHRHSDFSTALRDVQVHGDCIGADTDFHNLCVAYRSAHPEKYIKIHVYPPINPQLRGFNVADKTLELNHYLERNKAIVLNSDFLIACPVDKNKAEVRSGTWSTVRQARRHGIPVRIL